MTKNDKKMTTTQSTTKNPAVRALRMVLPQNQFDTGFEPMTFRSPVDRSTMKVTTDRNDF